MAERLGNHLGPASKGQGWGLDPAPPNYRAFVTLPDPCFAEEEMFREVRGAWARGRAASPGGPAPWGNISGEKAEAGGQGQRRYGSPREGTGQGVCPGAFKGISLTLTGLGVMVFPWPGHSL